MKVKLKARALWHVVERGGANKQEEIMALDALCSAVPSDMVSSIADKRTAMEAWQTISEMRVGNDCMKKSAAVTLRRKFDLATFNDGETVEDFALRLNSMATELATLGAGLEEGLIVEKIIRSVPQRFKQIVLAITTLLKVSTLTVSDLVGLLKAAEETFEEAPKALHQDGRLYLTEEEWNTRRKKKEPWKGAGGGQNKGSRRRGGGRQGRGRGRGGRTAGSPSAAKLGDECRRCGKLGHWARECPTRPKMEQAHAIQEEEEEASLLLLRSSPKLLSPVKSNSSSRTPSFSLDHSALTAPLEKSPPLTAQPLSNQHAEVRARDGEHKPALEIREEKVFAQLGEEVEHKAENWVLDTGATNHMSFGTRNSGIWLYKRNQKLGNLVR